MRPKIATFELKKHVIIKYEDLVYPSPASRCSSVAPAVRKALAQPKVQTCRGGQNAVGVQEFLVVILYIYIYIHTMCVYILYIYTRKISNISRQDPEVCRDSQRASGKAKMTMMMTMILMMMMMTMTMTMMMILISSRNPTRNPNDCMVNCSMEPGDFHIFLKPYKKPQ